jgi:hypothetical protein
MQGTRISALPAPGRQGEENRDPGRPMAGALTPTTVMLRHCAAVSNACNNDDLCSVVGNVHYPPVANPDAPLVFIAPQLLQPVGRGFAASARIFGSMRANTASSSLSSSFCADDFVQKSLRPRGATFRSLRSSCRPRRARLDWLAPVPRPPPACLATGMPFSIRAIRWRYRVSWKPSRMARPSGLTVPGAKRGRCGSPASLRPAQGRL